MYPIVPIAILIGVGVFLEEAFVGLLHALGAGCVVIGVILLIVWLISLALSRAPAR